MRCRGLRTARYSTTRDGEAVYSSVNMYSAGPMETALRRGGGRRDGGRNKGFTNAKINCGERLCTEEGKMGLFEDIVVPTVLYVKDTSLV